MILFASFLNESKAETWRELRETSSCAFVQVEQQGRLLTCSSSPRRRIVRQRASRLQDDRARTRDCRSRRTSSSGATSRCWQRALGRGRRLCCEAFGTDLVGLYLAQERLLRQSPSQSPVARADAALFVGWTAEDVASRARGGLSQLPESEFAVCFRRYDDGKRVQSSRLRERNAYRRRVRSFRHFFAGVLTKLSQTSSRSGEDGSSEQADRLDLDARGTSSLRRSAQPS